MNTPKGFLFSTVEAAIKKPGRKDLALIYSERECAMSGMFTKNRVKAAPVLLDMQRIRRGVGQAVVVNSGNANACTGGQGMKDAKEMAALAAEYLGLKDDMVYICSTGVIGAKMPMDKIRPGIRELVRNIGKSDIKDAAAAIMTTDIFPKIASRKINIGGRQVNIAGICKGAGMICPDMATMLAFIMTDANIERQALRSALRIAVKNSFNSITVDGDMSTNDTVLIMANGAASNKLISEKTGSFKIFATALAELALELSMMIVKDGEGASKIAEIEVRNAKGDREAKKAASAIANSLLVKTALYGNDANWGRIMAAIGYSGIIIKADKIDIFLNGLKIVSKGLGTGMDREANKILRAKEVKILVDLHMGKGSSKVFTCDLTENYIKINAEYRT
ncbi:MAG: bifunctional glutamate N-acetyltransferase/amino-acid acetyltransferase ArgJ [Nitrospirae bacterium]|nr:bifunctional glutamate N-acetyltransferase/amino-acid acetyltransferase ArgJ [Nitrospirota bacterium]